MAMQSLHWGSARSLALISVFLLAGKEAPAGEALLLQEAARQFSAMKSTAYQHRTKVDEKQGIYRYDCVGFVSYALRRVTPKAWASVAEATGLARGRIPSPPKYRFFFDSLAGKPHAGWVAVRKVAELRAGDVVAWEHRTETSSGHAVVVAKAPVRMGGGEWLVEVYDSTSAPHGEDTRRTDQRAEMQQEKARRGGLGKGNMVLVEDAGTSGFAGLRWSRKAKLVKVPVAAGRPEA